MERFHSDTEKLSYSEYYDGKWSPNRYKVVNTKSGSALVLVKRFYSKKSLGNLKYKEEEEKDNGNN